VIVVDTSVWIDFFNGLPTPKAQRLHDLLGQQPLLVGDLILLEILQGFGSERDARRVQEALSGFDVAAMLSPGLAVKAASNYRQLRRAGITIRKTIDLIIGTFCIEHGHELLHADRNFDLMRRLGLRVL
jgi:predicted nucleic acid-binding protein